MEKEQVRVLYWGDPKKKDTSSGQRVWRKTRFRLHRDGIKYVVHEPDEQGEPVVGVVRFQVSVAHTPFYASEKIAEKSNAYGSPRRVACQFVYHHDGSHWQPAQLRWWWHGPTGQGAEVDPRLRPFFSPTE